MSSRKIICAIGAQGVGKDYLMNRLQQRLIYTHGYHQRTVRCRFADSLNEAVSAILGIDSRELQDRSLKEVKRFSFDSPRYLPRKGTETTAAVPKVPATIPLIRHDIYPARGRKLAVLILLSQLSVVSFATIFTPQGDGNQARTWIW